MHEKNDKRRIYQLIDLYLSDRISTSTFCYEFYCAYDLELNFESLSKDEYIALYNLSEVTIRFSEFEKDIKNYPGVYSTNEDVRKQAEKTKEKLINYFNVEKFCE